MLPSAAPTASPHLVCTEDLDRFRVVMASAIADGNDIALNDEALRALGTDRSTELRWSPGQLEMAA
jgi:arginine/ornithine N-succinyltransferase beta subunit